jgi:RNA polymerase sigma factor (sigma-70 family)
MDKTLKMLESIIDQNRINMPMIQLVSEYKESLSPALFALAFKKVYKLALYQARSFYGLSDEDICSFTLEKLDEAMLNFDTEKGAKFETYFTTVIHNKFRQETQHLQYQKRKVIFHSTSYDKLVEDGFDIEFTDSQLEDIQQDLIRYNLTKNELAYCLLSIKDYDNKDIAEILNVSKMTVSNIRKKLRDKFQPLALKYYII